MVFLGCGYYSGVNTAARLSNDNVLTRQIEEKIKKNFEATQKIREQELAQKSEELKKQAAEIAESKKNIESVN